MKKKLFIVIVFALFLTGCSCTYNLTISDDKYSEEVIIKAESNDEINSLNKTWEIPISKNEFNIGTDPSSEEKPTGKIYQYDISNNDVTFKNDFTYEEFSDSSAVSKCYNNLNVTKREGTIVISTSQKAVCFENNPPLSSIVINITVDRPVLKNNADKVNGNTYTWTLNRSNAKSKDVNLILDNSTENTSNNEPNTTTNNNKGSDYIMYIFAFILLVVFLSVYFYFYKMQNKQDNL